MNLYKRIKKNLLKSSGFLAAFFIVSLSANAASIDIETTFWSADDALKEGLFFSDYLEVDQLHLLKQVRHEYKFVLGLVKEKKYDLAKERTAFLIEKNPEQSAFYNLKALLEIVDGSLINAEKSFRTAIEINSRNFMAYMGLGKLALDQKQYQQAEEYIDRALEINPKDIKSYQVLADIVMQQQGINAAEEVLLNANKKIKGNLKAELELLKLLEKVYVIKKQTGKLLPIVTEIIERNPKDVSALSALVRIQLLNKNNVSAEKTLRQIISRQPDNAEQLFLLAQILGQQKDKEQEVLALLGRAEKNQSNPLRVLAYKAAFLIKKRQFDMAFSIARRIDKSYQKINIGKILQGDIYLAEKKYKKALKSYRMAYQISPSIKLLDAMLSIMYMQNTQQEIVTFLEKELEINSANKEIQFRLAVAYQKAGDYDLSIKHYEELLSTNKNNPFVLNNLALLYNQQKNTKALGLAKKAYEKASHIGEFADTYGYVLLNNGYIQESLKVLEQAARLAPTLTSIQLHLAEAYSANQNKAMAKKILQKIIDINDKEKPVALKVLKQLQNN